MEKASTFMARVAGVASLAILNCVPVAAFAAPEYRLGDTPVSFSLSLGDMNEKAPSVSVRAADMESLSVETNAEGAIRAVWKGSSECGKDFRVTATFSPREDGGYDWKLAYSGYESRLSLEQIAFPVLAVPRTDETRIMSPMRLPEWSMLKPGEVAMEAGPNSLGTRFMATLTPGMKNRYVDLRGDARRHVVTLRFEQGRAPHTVDMSPVFYVPVPVDGVSAKSGEIPYGGVVRTFDEESWFAPAEYYRGYAKKQEWYAAAARLRSKAPELRDVGLWMWNRGKSALVTGIVDRVMRDTGAKVTLDWYWWHANPYGRDAPYYWPARENMDTFKGAIKALREKGAYVQAYINGVSCDVMHPKWSERDWAETVVLRNGEYRQKTWNPFFKHPSATMCHAAADVFHDRLSFLCRNLSACGLNCVYLDQVSLSCSPCWSRKHGHTLGGGTYDADAKIRLVERLRRENPGIHYASEGANEACLGLFESLIMVGNTMEKKNGRTSPAWTALPVFQAVYHPVVSTYGSYATIDNYPPWDELWPEKDSYGDLGDLVSGYPDEFAVEVARTVTWGMKPSVHGLYAKHADDPKTAASYRFLCDTVKFYVANLDLLYDGEMLDPGAMDCAGQDVKFLKFTTYAPKGSEKTIVQKALPTVFHSVWRAPGGRTAAVLANWSRAPQRYRLETRDIGKVEGVIPPRSWICRPKSNYPK